MLGWWQAGQLCGEKDEVELVELGRRRRCGRFLQSSADHGFVASSTSGTPHRFQRTALAKNGTPYKSSWLSRSLLTFAMTVQFRWADTEGRLV